MSIEHLISASLVRMQAKSPFFAALALFAKFKVSAKIPTAATDGRDIFVNPDFFTPLTPSEQDGLLAHEVLHAALLHAPRRHGRDPKLWNIAADIVINGMLLKEGYELPKGGLRDQKLEHLSTEEIYEKIFQNAEKIELPAALADLIDEAAGMGESDRDGVSGRAVLEKHWEHAQRQARMAQESSVHGALPKHLEREFGQVLQPQLDWKSYLWRYLVQTPTDFTHFDRRFVGQGLYLETLSGESVRVHVCVDTSGSINENYLRVLLSEVQAILQAYPHILCSLYYADTKLHGPYELKANAELPRPIGGGGTDFRPFFAKVTETQDTWTPTLAIYLTDGFGDYPADKPNYPVLWVVTPGGKDLNSFPFGEAVRLTPNQ